MNDLTSRFLAVYDYLKEAGRVSNKVDFAQKLEISSSTITDITKNRTNPGINVIRGFVKSFPEISIEWLIEGEGQMVKKSHKKDYTPPSNYRIDVLSDSFEVATPQPKSEKLHPKTGKILHPTLHPKAESCQICEEKDKVIAEQQARIMDLKEYIELLKDQIPGQKKSVG